MEIGSGNSGLFSQLGVYKKQSEQTEGVSSSRFKKSGSSAQGGGKSGDTINLSGDAYLLNEARGAANSSTDVRQDKVASIKAQLADGTYKVDTQKIAQGILSDEQGLL